MKYYYLLRLYYRFMLLVYSYQFLIRLKFLIFKVRSALFANSMETKPKKNE